jgi:MFS family permease
MAATAAGILYAAPAAGALVSGILSGPLGRVRRHGLAIILSIFAWGLTIAVFGLVSWLPLAALMLALAGAADNVSAVFRSTMLQSATPDEFRGRLQGVFTVVVAGGPRLGDVESGAVAALAGETFSVVSGGIACIAVTAALVAKYPAFLKYDAENPVP